MHFAYAQYKQTGFTPILIVILIAIVGAIVGGAYYFGFDHGWEKSPNPTHQATSSVETANPNSIGANWKTYQGEGFSFKYPYEWDYTKIDSPENDPDIRPVGVGKLSTEGYPKIRFFKSDEKGNTQLTINIKNDQSLEQLSKSLKIESLMFGDKKYLKYSTGIYISLDPENKTILSINRPRYPDELDILDQILSTFKFLDQNSTLKDDCIIGGCGGELCSDQELVSTCESNPQAVCYQNAICEKQTDGKCGWTITPELETCLKNPPK